MAKEIVPAGVQPMSDEVAREIEALARRSLRANGGLMKIVAYVGGKAENALELLPDEIKDLIEEATTTALDYCYRGASAVGNTKAAPNMGNWGHRAAAAATGAAGGFAGLSTAIVELPVTVSIMFGAIRKAAAAEGFDPEAEEVRLECLRVFGAGGPLAQDDGTNTSFLTSRIIVNGTTVNKIIASVAPKFAALLTQKLASQTLPVLGGVAGATVNFAFTGYFQEVAEIRFRLLRLSKLHGEEPVALTFRTATKAQQKVTAG